MAYEIRLEKAASEALLNKLNVWAHPAFLDAIASTMELEAQLLTVYKGEEVLATMPLYERSKLHLKYMVNPVLAYYQPLQYYLNEASSASRQSLDKLRICTEIARYLKSRYAFIDFQGDPTGDDVRGFTWEGLTARPLYTYVYHKDKPLHLLKDEQKKLRLAEERGYSLDSTYDPEAFLRLHKAMSDKKHHSIGLSGAKLCLFFNNLHEAGLLGQRNVLLDGRIVSSNVFFAAGSGTAYTVYRASLDAELAYGVSTWHSVKLIQDLCSTYDRLDFCGANVPEVARFKAAMGLDLEVFYRVKGRGRIL